MDIFKCRDITAISNYFWVYNSLPFWRAVLRCSSSEAILVLLQFCQVPSLEGQCWKIDQKFCLSISIYEPKLMHEFFDQYEQVSQVVSMSLPFNHLPYFYLQIILYRSSWPWLGVFWQILRFHMNILSKIIHWFWGVFKGSPLWKYENKSCLNELIFWEVQRNPKPSKC